MLNMELARKYARAIFELACEENKLKEFGEDIAQVQRLYTDCPELKSYLGNPNFRPEDKKSLLKEIFAGGIQPHVLNFLLLLVDKRRMHVFDAISAIFVQLSNEKLGIAVADVTAAEELDETQLAELRAKLEQVTGKQISLRRHRDPSLIGGVVVRIGDRRIDGSIKGRLEAMTAELMAN
ncbi:F0F1 ATP synthase subunit delta [Selenomonas sp. F0473]|uniref:F0F1 ATP synthase subunit delta n=1 Tax=Selenomonas sp. F0473 TaxID=999423 RepID=UPI00029E0AE9|nr:F0F1 ATP synthase subunit delta [Selenomonas sp. F0473]EKU71006.1 ATP synthase F1, delta subunit [Selenomonas sp. F0473]